MDMGLIGTRVFVAGAVLVAALSGCTSGSPGHLSDPPTSGIPAVPVHDRTAANALADALLARVVFPPGSKAAKQVPTARLSTVAMSVATSNVADAARFGLSPQDEASTLAFLRAHPPTGYSVSGGGYGNVTRPGQLTVEYFTDNISGMPPGVEGAFLVVEVAAVSPTRSDIRADVEVPWRPTKPAGLTVPDADVVATLAVTATSPHGPLASFQISPRQVTVTDRGEVARLRTAANSLQALLPGPRSCAPTPGNNFQVAFEPSTAQSADITFTDVGCGHVEVTKPGGTSTILDNNGTVTAAYREALGLPAD